jgi:penicillin-binding protein 1A
LQRQTLDAVSRLKRRGNICSMANTQINDAALRPKDGAGEGENLLMQTLTYPGRRSPSRNHSVPLAQGITGRIYWRKGIQIALFASLSIILLCGVFLTVWTARALRGLDNDLNALLNYHPGQATLIYAADGSLIARVAKENRLYAKLDRIPKSLQNATIAAEDRRFWDHSGVDFKGLGRALYRDIREKRAAEGGSTLTMQLVRNIQLTKDKTMERKVREAALALKLERIYDKKRLLEMYLNQVFYGADAYGVGAAARTYFGRAVENLTPAQSALLATLPRRPTEFNPYRDPEGSLIRRNALLKEMAAQGYLTARQLNAALREPLGVKPRAPRTGRFPYVVDAVVDRLIDLYGHEAVYQGGLKVYTTINPALQEAAEKSLTRGVHRLRGRNVTQGALVSLDPKTGEVKALVGGANYSASPFNRALQAKRQPGSSFKPFVYAAAMDMGLSPLDKITDGPIHLSAGMGPDWNPQNDNHRFAGQTTLANAFAQSMNIPAIKLAMSAGIPQVADVARSCGIRSHLREVPSLALGTSEVTPMELTAAYTVFANLGEYAEPHLLRRVVSPDGDVDDRYGPQTANVMDTLTAQKIDFMLRAVVEAGTGTAVRSIPRARGKTGTTQSDKDAWFVGYTPELVTGVWLGNDAPSRMHSVYGGNGCAPIWRSYMEKALSVVPKRPDIVTYSPPKPPQTQPNEMALTASAPVLKDAPEWSASASRAVGSPVGELRPTSAMELKADNPERFAPLPDRAEIPLQRLSKRDDDSSDRSEFDVSLAPSRG